MALRCVLCLVALGALAAPAARADTGRPGFRISWSARQRVGHDFDSLSCPTTSFCAITNEDGSVLTSTDPGGGPGAWHSAPVVTSRLNDFSQIACPSASLCVAIDSYSVWVSTDPAGGASTWHGHALKSSDGFELWALSCPRTTLCVVADQSGDVFASDDPASGRWSRTHLPGLASLDSLTCSSGGRAPTCVATGESDGPDDPDEIFTTTDPGDGARAWRETPGRWLVFADGVCPTAGECLLPEDHGLRVGQTPSQDLAVSTDPTRGLPSYRLQHVQRGHPGAVGTPACLSRTECVAPDHIGHVLTGDPLTGRWALTSIDPHGRIEAVACPSTTTCVAADENGRVLVGHVVDAG